MTAATVADIKALVKNKEFGKAVTEAEILLKKSPRDADLNYWYAKALLGAGKTKEGNAALSTAADRGSIDALHELAVTSLQNYDVPEAQKRLSALRSSLMKANNHIPDAVTEMESTLLLMSNQLNRVEDVPVLTRKDITTETYLNTINRLNSEHYRNSAFVDQGIPFYLSNTSREIFWTKPDEEGVSRLFTAGILDDGNIDEPVELTQYIGDGNIIAPFMLEDGETLYFASDREGGLGGYDIYMTRRDGNGGFYQPSNIGMPYNSPANDLLFVIDEPNNIGWWMTDRFAPRDSVAVFTFVPSEQRINVDATSPDLIARARMDDVKLTRPEGFDLKGALARIPKPGNKAYGKASSTTFTLSLGNGRVITSVDDFRNPDAAETMREVINMQSDLNAKQSRLRDMRTNYASGDKSIADDILSLEKEVEDLQKELKTLTNRVIRMETNGR